MKRSNCPITCALDILGDKWTLVIIRDALYKKFTTYGEFQSSDENIASNILAARLKMMVENGIFKKERDNNNKLKIHYILTSKGLELKNILTVVGDWGFKHIDGTIDIQKKIEELNGY